jgi:hypothetical protein
MAGRSSQHFDLAYRSCRREREAGRLCCAPTVSAAAPAVDAAYRLAEPPGRCSVTTTSWRSGVDTELSAITSASMTGGCFVATIGFGKMLAMRIF